jgi:prolyl oligopeptidase
VLLVHGLNDPRVDSWNSAKAAAALQAASSSGKPGAAAAGRARPATAWAAPRSSGFGKLADVYAFLLWQFGKAGLKP